MTGMLAGAGILLVGVLVGYAMAIAALASRDGPPG